jgi:hypothetical protein
MAMKFKKTTIHSFVLPMLLQSNFLSRLPQERSWSILYLHVGHAIRSRIYKLKPFPSEVNKLPNWFPGTGFRKTAREWSSTLNQMIELPYQYVKDQMVISKLLQLAGCLLLLRQASGIAPPSFTAKLLQERDVTPEQEFDIKWSAGSLYSAGADTVSRSAHTPPPKPADAEKNWFCADTSPINRLFQLSTRSSKQ